MSLSLVCIVVLVSLETVFSDCSSRDTPPQRITDICKNCSDLPEHLLECEDVYDFLVANENSTFKTVNGACTTSYSSYNDGRRTETLSFISCLV